MYKRQDLNPKVLNVDTNTLLYQVPGGMLSNLISQLHPAGKDDQFYDCLLYTSTDIVPMAAVLHRESPNWVVQEFIKVIRCLHPYDDSQDNT